MTKKKRHTIFHYVFTIVWFLGAGFVSAFFWFLVGLGGFFVFQKKISPYDIVVGLPLLLVALGFIVNSVWSAILSIFSLAFNKGSCPLCNPPMEKE